MEHQADLMEYQETILEYHEAFTEYREALRNTLRNANKLYGIPRSLTEYNLFKGFRPTRRPRKNKTYKYVISECVKPNGLQIRIQREQLRISTSDKQLPFFENMLNKSNFKN